MSRPAAYAIIMAGGWGERMWPLATPRRPKPTLKLAGSSRSLLAATIESVTPVVPHGHVYVAADGGTAQALLDLDPDLTGDRLLVEPLRRDTAGCVVYALARLLAAGAPEGSVVGFLASDSLMPDTSGFTVALSRAYEAAASSRCLVCIGVRPSRADTALGYLELDLAEGQPAQAGTVLPVRRFVEKPDAATAQQHLLSGRHLWNMGTVVGQIGAFRSAMSAVATDLEAAMDAAVAALREGEAERVRAALEPIEPRSIDYALLENAELAAVVADIAWDTLSGWEAMSRAVGTDMQGNALSGAPLLTDVTDSLVYVDPSASTQRVAVVGVSGLAVVVTAEGVLVMPKDRAQDLRGVVEATREGVRIRIAHRERG
jgi:mannose-1-phosphate guanylyltransferase